MGEGNQYRKTETRGKREKTKANEGELRDEALMEID